MATIAAPRNGQPGNIKEETRAEVFKTRISAGMKAKHENEITQLEWSVLGNHFLEHLLGCDPAASSEEVSSAMQALSHSRVSRSLLPFDCTA